MEYVYELAKKRTTIREFKDESIPLDDVIYALNVAKEAPSGANKQPWRFVIVTDMKKKHKIREFCKEIEKQFHELAPDWMKKWFKEISAGKSHF